jgi:glycolate oxidase FAD binding subunit
MLAFEPPHFGAGATFGGASRPACPARAAPTAARVRDFVLGAKLMDGKGEVLNFGGQVMKNVAGYDVSRLLAGSLGTLGLMLELSVKVLPRAVAKPRCASNERDRRDPHAQCLGRPAAAGVGSCWHGACWRCACRARGRPWMRR